MDDIDYPIPFNDLIYLRTDCSSLLVLEHINMSYICLTHNYNEIYRMKQQNLHPF